MKISNDLSYKAGSVARKIRAKLKLPVNQRLIRFCGIQRTGNHALINWIIAQEQLETCYINGAFPGVNPWQENWGISYPNFPYWPEERDARGELVGKELLLVSYENRPLDEVAADRDDISKYIGVSKSDRCVLVLRDPYNTFASWLKRDTPVTQAVVDLWKTYAYEFLGKQNVLGTKVCISFNEWFLSRDYRCQLAQQLGLRFTDRGVDVVSHHGGGSSFDGQALKGQTKSMKVLTRYHHYLDNPDFKGIFEADPELEYLSYEIFGDLPAQP